MAKGWMAGLPIGSCFCDCLLPRAGTKPVLGGGCLYVLGIVCSCQELGRQDGPTLGSLTELTLAPWISDSLPQWG